MAELRWEVILDDCLARLQAGETIAGCLAYHRDVAPELAPMLKTARQLQRVRAQRLSDGQRLRAKASLRAALVQQSRRPTRPTIWHRWSGWNLLGGRAPASALAGVLVVVLLLSVGVASVAASQPGDVAYALRTAVERAPALWQVSAAGRATVELEVAERRLADLERHLTGRGQAEQTAVDALLIGDEAAAASAVRLGSEERAAIAVRITAHAETLAHLGQSAAQPEASEALNAAAVRAAALAGRLASDSDLPGATSTPPTPPLSEGAASTQAAAPATPTPTVALPMPTAQPAQGGDAPAQQPTATRRAALPGQRATALAQTATAAPATVMAPPQATQPIPGDGRPERPLPGRRATTIAQTATAQPATAAPSPAHTPPPPRLAPSGTPAPGRRATAIVQTATARPIATASVIGKPRDTPAPGRRATASAETATAQAPAPGAGVNATATPTETAVGPFVTETPRAVNQGQPAPDMPPFAVATILPPAHSQPDGRRP